MRRFCPHAIGTGVALLLATGCGGDDEMMRGMAGMVPVPVSPSPPADESFRAVRPMPAAAAAFQFPRPEIFQLPSGLEVFLVERRSVPNVSWTVTFPGGTFADPPSKTGLASLCLNVSFQGSNTLPRQEREQALADMSSVVNLGAAGDYVSWTGEALRSHLGATADIWMDLFLAPKFSQEDFDGTLRARLTTLSAGVSQTPAAISSRVSSRLYWGREHPFNRAITAGSLSQVTLQDCLEFFRRSVQPAGAKLFVSGAVSRSELMTSFGRLASWSGSGTMTAPLPPAAPVPGRIFFVNVPGAPQSIITIRNKGPARTAPDYHAAEMMASILAGDSTSSRIGLNVREMRGYAYSVGGGFISDRAGGGFFFSAPVRDDATAESVFEVLEEIRKMRDAGVTMEELDRERRYRLSGLPYSFETARSTIAQYQYLDSFGIPFDFFDRLSTHLSAVDLGAIQQAAVSYLAPGFMQILVVGDATKALPKLRALVAMHSDLMGDVVSVLDGEGNAMAAP